MSDNPMSVFQQATKKKLSASESPAEKKPMAKPSLSTKPAELPVDWHEKLSEMCSYINYITEEGSKVPERFKMSEYEFEAYINNPSNFSQEDWILICEARSQADSFVAQMREVLKDYQPLLDAGPKKKKRTGISRNWISAD
jgi:hypothetical protein